MHRVWLKEEERDREDAAEEWEDPPLPVWCKRLKPETEVVKYLMLFGSWREAACTGSSSHNPPITRKTRQEEKAETNTFPRRGWKSCTVVFRDVCFYHGSATAFTSLPALKSRLLLRTFFVVLPPSCQF